MLCPAAIVWAWAEFRLADDQPHGLTARLVTAGYASAALATGALRKRMSELVEDLAPHLRDLIRQSGADAGKASAG